MTGSLVDTGLAMPELPDTRTSYEGMTMSKRRSERVRNGYRRRMLRQRVLAAYDVCAICGKPVDKTLKTPHPMSAEVDELVLVSRGGDSYSFANCRLMHRICNRMKSARPTNTHERCRAANGPSNRACCRSKRSASDMIPGRGPRVCHPAATSGAVPIFPHAFKWMKLGNGLFVVRRFLPWQHFGNIFHKTT